MDPLIGAVLGNYRITNALGIGGMGSVYRAQHELLGRPAAIKLLRPELTENADLVQRFFNEAKAATEIRHPAIVEVYDFGYTNDGHAYLVMELLDGQTLSRALAERRFDEHEAAQIARNIASALKGAHGKGIVHRDLKPDNIFLVPDPDGGALRVKVLDFGIAKLASPALVAGHEHRRTMTGVLLGTPTYMAPEQAREAATIDARADLYSLGCILYEMLVGTPPFVAEGAGELIAMQLFTEPERPSTRARVTPELDALVMRLLAKAPEDRPQSAAEVMDALVGLGARMSTPREAVAGPVGVEPVAPAKRSRLPFAIGGIVVLAAAATIAVVLAREAPAPAAPPPAIVITPAAPPTAPPPAPTPAAAVVEPAPVQAKKKPVTVKLPERTPVAPPVEAKPEKLKTANDSPIEIDVGDGPRQPKAP